MQLSRQFILDRLLTLCYSLICSLKTVGNRVYVFAATLCTKVLCSVPQSTMSLQQALGEKDSVMDLGELMDAGPVRNFPGCSLAANDDERNLAKEATAKFLAKDFVAAHDCVSRLADARPADPKVAVNVLVSRFCARHCTNGPAFVNDLMETCNKVRNNFVWVHIIFPPYENFQYVSLFVADGH